ncbi:MAG TPA: HAMP domain-containing sensor histidine kinase [Bacillota bacterium]
MSRFTRRLYDLWVRVGLGRSVFGRLLTAYTGLAVVGLLVIGLALSYLAGGYIRDQKLEELTRAARRFSLSVQQVVDAPSLDEAGEELANAVWLLSITLNMGVVLFADDGGVVAAAAGGEVLGMGSVSEDISARIREGRTVTASSRLVPEGPQVLLAAVPVGSEDQVVGGVLVYTPVADLDAAVARFRETILWVALAVSLLSIAVGSYVSWTISRPLRQLRRVVAGLSAGQYPEGGVDPDVYSEDEIGELAAAIVSLGERLGASDRYRSQAEESRRRLLADVSHELRTPLTSIRGFTEVLLDELDDNPQARRRYLRLIHEQTLHLSRLVQDLLDLSRLEAGDIHLVRLAVDLGRLVEGVAERLRPNAEAVGAKLTVVVGEEPLQVIGDPDRLEQIITNLCTNALEVSGGGEVTLTVRGDEREACLEVADTGPGIDPTDLPYIWQRFYRGRSDGDGRGTGLGLAIVRQLVELHGGRVAVDTQPGQGARFSVFLPRVTVTSRS